MKLKNQQFSEQDDLTLEKRWEEQIKLIEELEEYSYLLETASPVVDESTIEIYTESVEPDKKEEIDFNESVINRLADRIVKTIRSTAVRGKTEDLDGGIGVDDIGRDAGLLVPLGGGGNAALVEPNDPEASKTATPEAIDHLKQSIEVLKKLGYHGKAGELGSVVSQLQPLN
jgi:hypothetical protein